MQDWPAITSDPNPRWALDMISMACCVCVVCVDNFFLLKIKNRDLPENVRKRGATLSNRCVAGILKRLFVVLFGKKT